MAAMAVAVAAAHSMGQELAIDFCRVHLDAITLAFLLQRLNFQFHSRSFLNLLSVDQIV